ncbi:NUDIX hydrolase [Demetria terragena]|uniref:NUDIX hydrolase n=1 Tax=Demetria terragena TaxID=63959 RepID=UPI0003A88216|nr:NUDIX hydrolase [Demetria terragena]
MSGTKPAPSNVLMPTDRPLLTAGALVWRLRGRKIEVALIHRPRYDDWSWPKGKIDPGEQAPATAVREVAEETGLEVRLGPPLPRSLYAMPRGDLKEVRYWAASVTGGDGALLHEVDEVAWLTPGAARRRLTHPRDVLQVQALTDAHERKALATWPLLVVRHGHSVARSQWQLDDWLRPLDDDGSRQAEWLVPLLGSYGVERIISSPSTRCLETMEPYVRHRRVRIDSKKGLSEERYAEEPDKVIKHTDRALQRGIPTALCTHRPLVPAMLQHLEKRADSVAVKALEKVGASPLDKGEVLVCHMSGVGEDARVVAVERHQPGVG